MPGGKRVIEIVPYNPHWEKEFTRIKEMIESYIGDLIITVEHVGSTSVEGLAAKPIIDLDVVIENYDLLPEVIKGLARAGYEHEGNLGVEGREAFRRVSGENGLMNHHLYVCPQDGKGHLEHIAFRDYLRANAAARREYEALKISLAQKYQYDIENYSNHKSEFVRAILNRTIYRD